jgi:hypothetical protein
MNHTRRVLLVALFVTMAAAAPAAAQEDDVVTLTVAVETGTGAALPDATIAATWDGGSAEATTASNGKAFVDVPAGARVELDASHPDYVRNFPLVVENATERDVTVAVAPRASLAVTAEGDDGPLADASVVLRRDGRIVTNGRTDDDGRFETGSVEAGDYDLAVVKAGYYRNATDVTVEGEARRTVALESGAVTYTVAVVDPHFDPAEPVPEATVAVDGVGSVQTLRDGETTARLPVNAELDVTVSKAGYVETSRTLSVGETAGNVTVDLSRTPSLSVSPVNERVVAGESVVVEVTNAYDEPVAGATVLRNDEAVGQTDEDGEVAVTIPDAGEYELGARQGDVRADAVTVTGVRAATDTPTPTETETATATPTGTATDSPSSGFAPGFSPLAALVAAVAFALLVRRR